MLYVDLGKHEIKADQCRLRRYNVDKKVRVASCFAMRAAFSHAILVVIDLFGCVQLADRPFDEKELRSAAHRVCYMFIYGF